jgi:hypothetical protein
MPDQLSLGELHFLFFVIPGFISVWSYRYSTYSDKKGDFELLGLSFFWGIVIAGLTAFLSTDKEKVMEVMKNPYAAALAFSTLGSVSAFIISLSKPKNRIKNAWKRVRSYLK